MGNLQDSKLGDRHKPTEIIFPLVVKILPTGRAYIALHTLLFVGGAHADIKLYSASLISLHPLSSEHSSQFFARKSLS